MPAAKKAKQSQTIGDLTKKVSQIKTSQLVYILLLVAFFLIGYLVARVQLLEKGGAAGTNQAAQAPSQQQGANQGTGQAPKTVTNDDIKSWAKEVGLNTANFNSCFDSKKFQAQVDQDQKDGATAGVNGTPTFYINGIQLVGAQPFQSFKDAIDKELNGTTEASATRATVETGHLPVQGNAGAKVTLVEFSDFQCPFCERFYSDAYQQIKKEYVDTGKVKIYFRHFPLVQLHPMATPFALAAECANDQGQFWKFHDKIFTSQK